jgi:hypothetical protein
MCSDCQTTTCLACPTVLRKGNGTKCYKSYCDSAYCETCKNLYLVRITKSEDDTRYICFSCVRKKKHFKLFKQIWDTQAPPIFEPAMCDDLADLIRLYVLGV